MQACSCTHLPCLEQENGTCSGVTFDFVSASWTDSCEVLKMEPMPSHLDSAVELNRQLHASLQRKQEEISALKQRNAQLKELARQTEHYNITLDTSTVQAQESRVCASRCGCVRHPVGVRVTPRVCASRPGSACSYSPSASATPWRCMTPEHPLLSSLPANSELEGRPRAAWSKPPSMEDRPARDRARRHHTPSPNSTDSSWGDPGQTGVFCPPDAKRLKQNGAVHELDSEPALCHAQPFQHAPLQSRDEGPDRHPPPPGTDLVQLFGAFHGLQVMTTALPLGSDLSVDCRGEEGVCFKTSIRDHNTIRTMVFPHGKTFTSHTPDGGCRFLWVPLGTM
ncbi:multicilin [Electrophorus electricus]|uniref:multicilin n=1 Tax=Electrophorus electricus TaxID=8005 RepID=UPI0015D0919D|nr:multicilin [Electrophorus electricus]